MVSAPLASPLKQVNTQGKAPPSKLEDSWRQLSHHPLLFTQGNPTPLPSRWLADFFCLQPSLPLQNAALDRLSTSDLLGPYQHNIAQLFAGAVHTLRTAPPADVTRSHAVETLIPLCRNVLSREYPDPSDGPLAVLAGPAEGRDQVLTDFVSAIDLTLQDAKVPVPVRHRTLQLALFVVASVQQGALVAAFLRRDLFPTLVAFIADRETRHFTFEAALLLGLLANYRKTESRNPYGVRIEDLVEEGVMERIIQVTSTVCLAARDAYLAAADDTPPSLTASLSSLVWSTLRIGADLFTGGAGAFTLPPPPAPPRTSSSPGFSEKGKGRAEVEGEVEVEGEGGGGQVQAVPSIALHDDENELARPDPQTSSPPIAEEAGAIPPGSDGTSASATPVSSPPSLSSPRLSASPPPLSPPSIAATGPAPSRTPSPRPGESPFARLPPPTLVLLLPFFELLNANKTFSALVLAPRTLTDPTALTPPPPPPLVETLISLTSYIVCHASTSPRARTYARLCLVLCMIFVEEGDGGKLSAESKTEGGIRLCRQRHPALPQRDDTRIVPLSALIDTVVIFLRHNLHKRLDVELYAIALRLLQRIFQQLKSEHVRLERDWVMVWRAMLSLASFIVSHRVELRNASDSLDTLISQLFITLAYAAYWAAQLLPSPLAQAELFYEILHADETLSALSDLLGISSVATPHLPGGGQTAPINALPTPGVVPPGGDGAPSGTRRETPTRAPFFAGLPLPPSQPGLARGLSSSSSSSAATNGALSPSGSASRLSPHYHHHHHHHGHLAGGSGRGTGAGFVATECISNLRSIITFFRGAIDTHRREKQNAATTSTRWWFGGGTGGGSGGCEDEPGPDEILAVIRERVGGVELIESAAMGDLPRYSATTGVTRSGSDAYVEALAQVACADTLQLMKSEPGM